MRRKGQVPLDIAREQTSWPFRGRSENWKSNSLLKIR
jgi:hypothetical protein